MRRLRANDWELIVAGINVILALFLLHMLNKTGADAYAVGAAWCGGSAMLMLGIILRRVL